MGYSALAKVYDKLMGDFDYDGYYRFIQDKIHGDIVELAIGSGEFTKRYASVATSIIGVDVSTEMLGICAVKLTKFRRKCLLINDDLRSFKCQRSVDTVLCICDGLNYVPDILAIAAKVKSYLKVGGSFIFDISSEYKLKNILGNNTFYEEEKDICYVWQNFLSQNAVDMNITIFTKTASGEYLKSFEEQRQYIHNEQLLSQGLIDMGYVCDVYDGESYGVIKKNSNRLLYVLKVK